MGAVLGFGYPEGPAVDGGAECVGGAGWCFVFLAVEQDCCVGCDLGVDVVAGWFWGDDGAWLEYSGADEVAEVYVCV